MIDERIEKIKSQEKYRNPKSLIPYGYKVFSQFEEDGLINEIFCRIGVINRIFIEFGAGNGLENNTLALLFKGWKGLWIDSSARNIHSIQNKLAKTIKEGKLIAINDFVTTTNINRLISSNVTEDEIDLLSIDIDGNDFHIFNAIDGINPRVVVIEYNAKFPPPLLFIMKYDEAFRWKGDDYFGASLKFLEVNMKKKGYCLVGCSLTGVNAFFIREDLVQDKFLEPFTAEFHYEPARYYLAQKISGHFTSFSSIDYH
jgi:hypothetical protein